MIELHIIEREAAAQLRPAFFRLLQANLPNADFSELSVGIADETILIFLQEFKQKCHEGYNNDRIPF